MNATVEALRRDFRNPIHCLDAALIAQTSLPAGQYILRFSAPEIARGALPGQFVHLQCDPLLPMRRPFSIMLTDPAEGTLDILYKAVGYGTGLLSKQQAGSRLSMLGPIGRPFTADTCTRPLLIGGGVGIPPMVFLAQRLQHMNGIQPMVVLGSEVPFPFQAAPSRFLLPGMPDGAIAAMPLLEDWGFPCRLASKQGLPGCFDGYVTDIAAMWLETLEEPARRDVVLYACGPHAMLHAVAKLAERLQLEAQLSLEEFMACAVGGCAGCSVLVHSQSGHAMKRVCVDGPVFRAADVIWNTD